jgi:hypothetical protein
VKRIILLFLIFGAITGKAQDKEHFSLFTDRDVYVSGETLLLKVFAPADDISGVVNVDLINSKGKIICGISKKILDHQADGFIDLPDSLSSGCYLLCTSTKINPSLTVKELYICNRFTGLPESGSVLRAAPTNELSEKFAAAVQIEGLDKTYKTRGKVDATLKMPPELLSQTTGKLFISISENVPGYSSRTFFKKASVSQNPLIEKEGVVLEGIIKDDRTRIPFAKGTVLLSIPDTIQKLNYFITGQDGRFNFQLDSCYGKIPLVIQGFDPEEKLLVKLALNLPDSMTSVVPDYEPWTIVPEFKKYISNSIEAITFRKIFDKHEFTFDASPKNTADAYSFYGKPTEIIDPRLFIDLPDFTEVSRELLPGVKFRAHNRIPTMQIFNPSTRSYFERQPLLLLDGIPFRDLNIIKGMGSKEIDKIEIVRSERYYGDLMFPGVVAIHTTNPDLNRLNESSEVIKLHVNGLQPGLTLNIPDKQPLNEPDLRKVLLWKPSVEPEQTIQLDFETSDIHGDFKLIIHGKSNDGSIFYKEQTFVVN